MGNKLAKKLNILDLAVIVIFAVIFISTAFYYIYPKKNDASRMVSLTVRSVSNVGETYPEAQKLGQTYLNSVNKPVSITKANIVKAGDREYLDITIVGPGLIEGNRYIFNGQRVLIGQKAELHGGFWVQGIIANITYEN